MVSHLKDIDGVTKVAIFDMNWDKMWGDELNIEITSSLSGDIGEYKFLAEEKAIVYNAGDFFIVVKLSSEYLKKFKTLPNWVIFNMRKMLGSSLKVSVKGASTKTTHHKTMTPKRVVKNIDKEKMQRCEVIFERLYLLYGNIAVDVFEDLNLPLVGWLSHADLMRLEKKLSAMFESRTVRKILYL